MPVAIQGRTLFSPIFSMEIKLLKYTEVHSDAKLLSEFLFIGHGNPDNNSESPCIIFLRVRYSREACYLKSRKNRLRAFGWRVLRGIFRSKRDRVTEKCVTLHIHDFHNSFSPPNIRTIKSNKI